MISPFLFVAGTLLISLNFFRFGGIAISDWFYLFSTGFAILETMSIDKKNQVCWFGNKYLPYVGLIIFGAILSLFRTENISVAFIELVQFIFVSTLFISLIWILVRRGKIQTILKAFVFSGFFSAGISIIDFLIGSSIGPLLSYKPDLLLWGRYAGTLGHPNKFGFFLVITALLSTYFIASNIKWRRLFWIICFVVHLIGIYLSGSLTAYIGLCIGLFWILFLRRWKTSLAFRIITGFILLFIIFIGGVISLFPEVESIPIPENQTIITVTLDRVQSITAESRLILYKESFQSIMKNPIIGYGFDQLSTSGISYYQRYLSGTVHNAILQIFYLGGFFSFLGLILIYANLTTASIRTVQQTTSNNQQHLLIYISAAVIAIIIMDQFQDAIYQREKWLAIGLFISSYWQTITIESKTRLNIFRVKELTSKLIEEEKRI